MEKSDKVKIFNRTVNYYETDKMGITHHSNYVKYMEEARIFYLKEVDCCYSKLESMGIVSPVVSISCDFKYPSTFNDELQIEIYLKEYNGIKFTYQYKMTNIKTGKIVFEGTSSHCFINSNGLPIIIKKSYPELDKVMKENIFDK